MTKNRYQVMIHTYLKRKEYYKLKDKVKYANNIKKIAKRINVCRTQIWRLNKRYKIINDLIDDVNYYFDVDIRAKKKDLAHALARNVFYKYGLENNLRGCWLNFALGKKWELTATDGRKRFTKSFKTKPKNKEAYYNFKTYQSQK